MLDLQDFEMIEGIIQLNRNRSYQPDLNNTDRNEF